MSGFSGVHGNVTWAGKASLPQNVHSWTMDIEHEAPEITPFSPTSDARVFTPLILYGWSGSFDLYLDHTTPPTVAHITGIAANLVLHADTGYTFQGCAICEVVSITTPVDGVITATVNFRGTGPLDIDNTHTTATPCTPAP